MREPNASKLLAGSFYGLLSWIGPLALSIIITPQIVHGLGLESYGILSLVMGIVAFSINVNVSRALTKYIAEYRAAERESEIPALVTSTLVLVVAIAFIVSFGVMFGTRFLLNGNELVSPERTAETATALLLGVAIVSALLINQAFAAVLLGYEELRLYSLTTVFTGAGNLLLSFVIVKMGYGFVQVLWGTLCATLAATLFSLIVTRSLLRTSMLCMPDARIIRKVAGYSKWVVGYQLLGYFILLFERLEITRLFGAETLSFYVVPMMIGIQFHGMIGSLALFIFPLMSTTATMGEELRLFYRSATNLSLAMATAALLATLLHGHQFLLLWLGADFAENSAFLFSVQMIGFSALAVSVVGFQTIEGTGRPKVNFLITAVVSAVTMGIMVLPAFGEGVGRFALARAVGFGLWIPALLIIEKLLFNKFQRRPWLRALSSVAAAAGLYLIVFIALRPLTAFGWNGLILSVMLETGAAFLCLLKLGYFNDISTLIRKNRSSKA